MAQRTLDYFPAGGVDSASNPINEPDSRYLYCRNLVPQRNGSEQLRDGYTKVPVAAILPSIAINSIVSYTKSDGTKYVLFWQDRTPFALNLSNFLITNPTVRGSGIVSNEPWSYALTQLGRLMAVNGTDKKFFDGDVWRDIGLRAPTADEVSNVVISEGVRELSTAEIAAPITVTEGAGGSFTNTTGTGMLFYVAIFDTSTNEIGPATIAVKAARTKITGGSSRKITIGSLPNLSSVNGSWIKLVARTDDGKDKAYFCTSSSVAITAVLSSATTLTVTAISHGLSTGDFVQQSDLVTTVSSGPGSLTQVTFSGGTYQVTVVDADHYSVALPTITLLGADPGPVISGTTSGTTKKLVAASNAATSVDVLLTSVDTTYLVNQDRGLAASVVDVPEPGYQFYGAIRNNVMQHVGNRIAIGERLHNLTRCNVHLTGLPDYSSLDTEWEFVVGRGGDGAETPYLIIDAGGNFITASSHTTPNTPHIAGLGANSGTGIDWVNPANVSSGAFFSTISYLNTANPKSLFSTLFSFGISSLENISGIQVDFEGLASAGDPSATTKFLVQLLKNGVPVGEVKTIRILSGVVTPFSAGGPTDLWLTSWDDSDPNQSDFGVSITPLTFHLSGPAYTANFSVRKVRITVFTTGGSSTFVFITEPETDGNFELPTRNGLPANLDKIWREGDHMVGTEANSPTVRFSESELDSRQGKFLGDPAQSWAADSIDTFPTADHITCGQAYDQTSMVYTQTDMAISSDLSGERSWMGPFNKGCCGQKAWTRGWKNYPFWISSDKELCTMSPDGPIGISSEYEAALLRNIGAQYLSQTESSYFIDTTKQTEHLRIHCRDANGEPFDVIHDFSVRDDRSPYGLGYDQKYENQLENNYTIATVRDPNGILRMWAGGSDGQLYQLQDGANDNGEEFTGDCIKSLYLGPDRNSVNDLEWWGDRNIEWFMSTKLDTTFDITKFTPLLPQADELT